MHKLSPEVKKTYQDNPEKFFQRKMLLVEMCEEIIRESRPFFPNSGLTDYENLKARELVESAPYSKEEQDQLKRFDCLYEKCLQFDMIPDREDIKKFVETGRLEI